MCASGVETHHLILQNPCRESCLFLLVVKVMLQCRNTRRSSVGQNTMPLNLFPTLMTTPIFFEVIMQTGTPTRREFGWCGTVEVPSCEQGQLVREGNDRQQAGERLHRRGRVNIKP